MEHLSMDVKRNKNEKIMKENKVKERKLKKLIS